METVFLVLLTAAFVAIAVLATRAALRLSRADD